LFIAGELHGEKEALPASIYPDINGWPTLPPLDIMRLGMEKEKLLLRRYFTLTSCRFNDCFGLREH
jgi:hypothetical protein